MSTRLATVVAQALEAEQARLRALPVRDERGQGSYARFYGTTLTQCHYTGNEPTTEHMCPSQLKTFAGKCAVCDVMFTADQLVDGEMPEHARLLPKDDEAIEIFEILCVVTDVDPWSDGVSGARAQIRDSRCETLAGRLAVALPGLTAVLTRMDATTGAAKAVDDLLTFKLDREREVPFFSETSLYELLGKDDARSLLSRTRTIARVTGYQKETG